MIQEELPAVLDHEEMLAQQEQAREAAIERQQIEAVFCLGGGELEDKPWTVWIPGSPDDDESVQMSYTYWYEGPPDYEDKGDQYNTGVSYRTVIECCLFGDARKTLIDRGVVWTRVRSYVSSGEAECTWNGVEESDEFPSLPCDLCEAKEGEEHGCVYLGEGWTEVVYRSFDRDLRVDHEDTCLGCYITDHHGRAGELLIGISVGQSLEESIQEALSECDICGADKIPDDITPEMLQKAFQEELSTVDLSDPNEDSEEEEIEGGDECRIWLVLCWNVDPKDKS